jgi:hypothetical protein
MSDEKLSSRVDDLLTKISPRGKPYLPDPLSTFRKNTGQKGSSGFKLIADQTAKKRAFDSSGVEIAQSQ